MKNRKRGFSLVELLIVLAVIAALIATITPVALNAIRKSQATKVAQNIKTLAAAIENAAYVNGITSTKIKNGPADTDVFETGATTIDELGRDIAEDKYGVWYYIDEDRKVWVAVFSTEEVDLTSAQSVVSDLVSEDDLFTDYFSSEATVTAEASITKLGLADEVTGQTIAYTFDFDVY